jgi:16S rRNA (guanine527-N7)-methyltransferase
VIPDLPDLSLDQFEQRLEAACGPNPAQGSVRRLYLHYRELRRWNRAAKLVGPGTCHEVVERHYAESLAGLQLIEPEWRTLVDIGSGAGFPGLILALVRENLEPTLVEPRERKCAFLTAAARKAALHCRCLDAWIGDTLPEGLPKVIDVVTSRAVRLPPEMIEALIPRMSPGGGFLLWAGLETQRLPASLVLEGRIDLPGAERRRILKLRLRG